MDTVIIKNTLTDAQKKLMGFIGKCYASVKSRIQAEKYIKGLLGPTERKNGWQLAEANGEKTPYKIQQFLYRAVWSADEVRDCNREYVKEEIGTDEAVLVADETGFLKKGTKSAGVKRQYSGTAGRIENCQVGVFLTYFTPKGFALIDRELYLPEDWINDRERCKAAGIPDSVEFKPKTIMALDMVKSAHKANLPFSWVTADSLYGDCREISMWLESVKKGYVLAVSGKSYVWRGNNQQRIADIMKELPLDGWERLSAGTGSKGERYYDWLKLSINQPSIDGWNRCLVVRRSVSKSEEVRAFICFYPEGTCLQKLVQVAGSRWTVEQSFEESKGEVGLDHYEVRSYTGWYKHITLSCCAHSLLAVIKTQVDNDTAFQAAVLPDEGHSLQGFKKGRGL